MAVGSVFGQEVELFLVWIRVLREVTVDFKVSVCWKMK
jgi:hypothetical protein